jgi:DNA mismatch repair protein MutS
MDSSLPSTPLMRQYHSIKKQVPNTLLLFRLGDFFELFYDDALVASRELQITLTSRNKEKGQPIPMCGVPAHSADGYIAKLIAKGHRVAICDQVEDASKAKKLVRREVTRIITPGTASDASLLHAKENNYLAAVVNGGKLCGVAYADVSTGEFRMTEMESSEVPAALEHLGAREVLFPAAGPLFAGENAAPERGSKYLRTDLDAWIFDSDYAQRTLCDHFKLHSLDGLGASGHSAAVRAAGALLHYVRDTQRAALQHLDPPRFVHQQDWMALDVVTVRNLELVEALFGGPAESTLLSVIDKTETSMGARLLRQWLTRPALDREEIESRLDGVEELCRQTISRTEIRRELGGVLDVERLLSRVTIGSASPRDLLALGTSLRCLPMLRALVAQLKSPRLRDLYGRLQDLPEVRERILKTLADNPPLHVSDGGVVRAGVDASLDELRDLQQNGRAYIAQMEAREKQATGIGSLKVRFNNIFGFYIEVSKPNLALVPGSYERKQTLVNHERFTTPELKEYERKVLDAEERIQERERALFDELRAAVAAEAQRIRATAAAIAELDVLCSLALIGAEYGYVRPQFNSQGTIQIAGGRHPVVERLMETESGERFIPNNVYLNDTDNLLAVITGPNMGGKSTYLRQVALICILAQMGSFIPAASATLPIIDRIFTRIGASDNLALGRSTFMVEMTETAQILNSATSDSLVLLDEVGRGTSTFDGLSIAWAVVEYIHARTRAKTLFATHYHELTELAELLTGVANLHVSVKESGDSILFLRKVEPGRADRSYGIEVARLAGLPQEVVDRARSVLKRHEEREQSVSEELSIEPHASPVQVSIFTPCDAGIGDELRSINLDELKPIEALSLLHEWKERLRRRKSA